MVVIKSAGGNILATKTLPGRTLVKDLEERFGCQISVFDFESTEVITSDQSNDALIPNLCCQKSLWNAEIFPNNDSSDLNKAADSTPASEYMKLFQIFFPPNMVSNRLEMLQNYQLLPGTKVSNKYEKRLRESLEVIFNSGVCAKPWSTSWQR